MNRKYLLLLCYLWVGIGIPTAELRAQVDTLLFQEHLIEQLETQWESLEELHDLDDHQRLEDFENASEELLERISAAQENRRPNLNDLSYEAAVNQLALSDFQYYQLQLYIETYGPLYSLYELEAIDGFTREELRRLADKAVVGPPPKRRPTFKELLKSGKHVLWCRYGQVLERQAGYDTSRTNHYDGSPAHLTFRYEYTVRQRFGIRIAGEKDAGEQFFRGAQKQGFDHYSGSAYLNNVGWLKRAVLGDFRLNFGQGLIMGSSLMSGKGAGVSATRRFGEGVRPVATTNESECFRGAAATLGNTRWTGTAFAGGVTESLRTAFGGSVTYRHPRFSVSGQAVCYGEYADSARLWERWQALVQPRKWNASLSYHALAGRQLFFGEAAIDGNGKPALLQAALFPVTPTFRLAALLRYFATGYQSPMGNGFHAGSGDCGEAGAYLAGHLVLSKSVEADLYADYYRLLWLSYRTDAPVQGMDAGVSLSCRLSRKSILLARYRWRSRPRNESEDPQLHRLTGQSRHKLRLQWTTEPTHWLKTKTEVNMVFNKGPDKGQWYKGILLYQDLAVKLQRPQLKLCMRVAYFDTDRYDERLYAYENDVYYAFTVGSYYYQGVRAYLLLRYKIKRFSIWFRISRTHYLNRETISSGLTLIEKPHKTEVRAMAYFDF